jgi:hypothetical protein
LDQVAKDVQKATAPVMLTETLPQICQAAKDNQVRANGLYANKGLAGVVKCARHRRLPASLPRVLRSDQVSVHAGTDNKLNVTQLSTGKTARVSGVVSDVSYDYNGCSISLKDATF